MNDIASNAEMMDLFEISDRTVTQYGKDGIFVRVGRGQYDVKASIRNVYRHLRDAASGRRTANEDLRAQKIRLTAAQADMAEMAKAVKAGAMADVAEFEHGWAHEVNVLRQRLLGLANKISEANPQFTQHEVLSIDETIRRMLEEIADEADARFRAADAALRQSKNSPRRARGQ